jgi:phosphate transport system substrate-binding protein
MQFRTLVLTMTVGAALHCHPALAQQKIVIDGSTGTAPLIDALGKAFTAKTSVAVEIGKGLGTKERLAALADKRIDIAMASHGLDVPAVTAQGMAVSRIAMTPVVFGVHETVKVDNLSDAQLCAIFAGNTKNWKEAGAGDLAIAPMARPDTEVDAQVAREGVGCLKALKLPESVKINAGARDMAKALAETPGSIGVTSATVVEQSGGKVKSVALNGVAPSEANVASGKYRLTRDAFLILGTAPSAQAKAFIDFVKSPEGKAVIKANGAIAATN